MDWTVRIKKCAATLNELWRTSLCLTKNPFQKINENLTASIVVQLNNLNLITLNLITKNLNLLLLT